MRIESGSTPAAIDATGDLAKSDATTQDVAVNHALGNDNGDPLSALNQNALTQTALFRRHVPTRPKRQSIKGQAKSKISDEKAGRESAIGKAEESFKQRIGERAHNKQNFHQLMKNIYGDRYDQKTVENLRQRALSGDFSFLPKARFVSDAVLRGNHAAYDAQSGTILLNEKLATNPKQLADYYAEEAGHHLDTFFGQGDAVGDEGQLLRHALAGESLSATEIAAIRAEDDSGTIVVDGKEVAVEFGFFKKVFKGVKKAFKGVAKGFKKVVGGIWDGIKEFGKWLATSTVGQYLVTAALAALSVVTAGVGTAAMVAWEAAKQAAIAVAKSVIIQKVTGAVGKVTGSETLGRIAGAIGSAFAGGKINVSSTAAFTKSAGTVAKDIAVNEAKRVATNEIAERIGSPFLQMAAGYAVNYGIDAAGDYAYGRLTGAGKAAANDDLIKNKESSAGAPTSTETQDGKLFDIGDYGQKALDRVGQVSIGDAIKQLAPKELSGLISTIVGGDVRNFSVADLASAFKQGLNNFEGMSAEDVAAALQDYARNSLESIGEIDSADVARYANAAFDQAGELKVQDLVELSGYDSRLRDPAIAYLARRAKTTSGNLTLNDVFNLIGTTADSGDTDAPTATGKRIAG